VTGLAASSGGGKWCFVSLGIVSLVLYLYRRVYSEVVSALPLNGGSYNLMLNTTTKTMASVAACLSLVSYTATAVVSADSAFSYAQSSFWPGANMYLAVIGLLGIFALLNLLGLTESAKVALAIFLVHMGTLTVLAVAGIVKLSKDTSVLRANWAAPLPEAAQGSVALAIYFGFSSGMLGVSGFETASNFVEEQQPHTFGKVLRNMWFSVSLFNPLLAFLSVAIVPIETVVDPAYSASILGSLAEAAAGKWLKLLVAIDAVMVLSGSVLTAYVGVMGLARRLALDRLLPRFMLTTNKLRGTNHWIIIPFFLLCSSMFALLKGNTKSLGGVFTIAFLCVMSLFALGNLILKYKRGRLPRTDKAWWGSVVVALLMTVAGVAGNIALPGQGILNLKYFALYFSVAMSLVLAMQHRGKIYEVLFKLLDKNLRSRKARARQAATGSGGGDASIQGPDLGIASNNSNNSSRQAPLLLEASVEDGYGGPTSTSTSTATASSSSGCCIPVLEWGVRRLRAKVKEINTQSVVFFTRTCAVEGMNKAVQYLRDNEQAHHLLMVHCCASRDEIPRDFFSHVHVLDQCYPKLEIEAVVVLEAFCPDLIHHLALPSALGVPPNFMFITAPSRDFAFPINQFGGVRIVTH
jgi:amino acid transporter